MEKILTIAIPTYNRSGFVSAQVERVFGKVEPFLNSVEIIVVNNCSTDDTKIRLRELRSKYDFSFYTNDSNVGLIGNIIKCFSLAKAPFTWVLGDDDDISQLDIESLIGILQSNLHQNVNLVQFDCAQIDGNDNSVITESVYGNWTDNKIPVAAFAELVKEKGYSISMWISGNIVRTNKVLFAIREWTDMEVIAIPLFWYLFCGLSSSDVVLLKCGQITMTCNTTSWAKKYSSQIVVYDLPLIIKRLEATEGVYKAHGILPIVKPLHLKIRFWHDVIKVQQDEGKSKMKKAKGAGLITSFELNSVYVLGPVLHYLRKLNK